MKKLNLLKLHIVIEIVIIAVMISSFIFMLVPMYKQKECKLSIVSTGMINTASLSDGVQIMEVYVDGKQQDLTTFFDYSNWKYEDGKYTYNAVLEVEDFIQSNAKFHELSVKFLKNMYCGGADIYIDDTLYKSCDFYDEKDCFYELKLYGERTFSRFHMVSLFLIIMFFLAICMLGVYVSVNKNVVVTEENSRRIGWLDILKGIGIFLVIVGHGPSYNSYMQRMIWSVHMPLFFVVSGYTFKKRGRKEHLLHDWNNLLKPYIQGCICVMIANIIQVCIVDSNFNLNKVIGLFKDYLGRCIYGSGGYVLNLFGGNWTLNAIGALWFFCALFVARFLFNEILLLYENRRNIFILSCILSYVGGYLTILLTDKHGIWLPMSVQTGMTSVLFICLGYFIPQNIEKKKYIFLYSFCCFTYMMVTLYGEELLAMVLNRYPYGFFSIIVAMCGVICFKLLAEWIDKCSLIIVYFIKFLGKNSLWILIFHLIELNFIPWDRLFESYSFLGGVTSVKERCVLTWIFKVMWCLVFVVMKNWIEHNISKFYGKRNTRSYCVKSET